MDFYITLFDTREYLFTMEQNVFVHQKKLLLDYGDLLYEIPPGANNYVVIMTNGYRTDDIALRKLFYKKLAYIGVLGNKNKINKMFEDYKAEGISSHILNKVNAPIGIAIKSETPEEIAVSIAAEIIKVKNRN